MVARGLEPAEWCRRAEIGSSAVYNFLNGLSDSLSLDVAESLAAAEKVTIAHLFDESVTLVTTSSRKLKLYGFVQAGEWREIQDLGVDDPREVPVPIASVNFGEGYLLEIRGDSMNEIYPHGTLVEVVDLPKYNFAVASGNRVIVYRTNRQGLVEATCKQLVVNDQGAWLCPRSDRPEHKEWIPIPWPLRESGDEDTPRSDGVEEIRVVAVVVRAHTTEVSAALINEGPKKKIT